MDARTRHPGLHRLSAIAVTLMMTAGIPGTVTGAEMPSEIEYSTQGWVSTPASQTPLQFIGVQNGKVNGSEPFALGSFSINAQFGVTTTFDNTPVMINFIGPASYSSAGWSDTPPYITVYENAFAVSGHVDGTISPDGASNLVVTFDPQATLRIDIGRPAAGNYLNGLPFPLSDVKVPRTLDLSQAPGKSGYHDGRFTVMATIVPEPGSVAIFTLGIAALGFRRRWKRRVGR